MGCYERLQLTDVAEHLLRLGCVFRGIVNELVAGAATTRTAVEQSTEGISSSQHPMSGPQLAPFIVKEQS